MMTEDTEAPRTPLAEAYTAPPGPLAGGAAPLPEPHLRSSNLAAGPTCSKILAPPLCVMRILRMLTLFTACISMCHL